MFPVDDDAFPWVDDMLLPNEEVMAPLLPRLLDKDERAMVGKERER
jgi:hypothetical protein